MRSCTRTGAFILATLAMGAIGLRAEDAAPGPDAAPATQPAATQPSAQISPDARELIDQISAAYGKLNALTLGGTISLEIQLDGSVPERHSAELTSSFVAPNHFRHEVRGDVLIGSTGQKLYTFQADENAYTQADAPKDRVASKDLPKSVAGLLSMQDPSLLLAIAKNPADEISDDVTDATKVEDTSIAGAACPTLQLQQKDKSVIRLMADPGTHLLRQVTVDMTAQLQQRRADIKRAVMTVDYTQVKPDDAAKEALFAWAPPPGAKDADAAAAARPLEDAKASDLEGKDAPAFKLQGLDSKPVALADLKGKVVVIDFWATWCPPCRASLPHLNKLYDAQKEKGVQVFALDEQEDKGDVETFVKDTKLTVPVLLDSEGKVGAQYGVTGIPQTVVIGKDGKVKKVFIGFGEGSPEMLQKAVDDALKE